MAVSRQEILAFLDANQGMSDADIAASMQMYGVSPQQMIEATGESPSAFMSRYNTAQQELGIPQTGLAGSESAMNQGFQSALDALVEQQARAQQQYQAGIDRSQAQYDQGRADVRGSTDAGAAAIGANTAAGQAALRPYREMGEELIDPVMALSGGRGQEAFDQAVVQSPYMQYLQEQGERAVTRNASALGGLGGGRVMQELQRQGQGLSSQGLQQQFQNMSGLMGQGANAAQSSAQLSGQAAGALGGLFQNQGNQLAGLAQGSGNNQFAGGQVMGNSTNEFGQNIAQGYFNTGNTIAQNRLNVGQQIANNVGGTAVNMANQANQQGQSVSDLYGVQSGNLANLLSGAGISQADIARIMAQSQAQAAQTQSGQQAGLPGIPGVQQTTGIIGNIAGAAEAGAGAATALMALSDYRLKDNIELVGSDNGVNYYRWDWKGEYEQLTNGMPTTGVIAQELALTHPEAVSVHPSGFLCVDYSKVN